MWSPNPRPPVRRTTQWSIRLHAPLELSGATGGIRESERPLLVQRSQRVSHTGRKDFTFTPPQKGYRTVPGPDVWSSTPDRSHRTPTVPVTGTSVGVWTRRDNGDLRVEGETDTEREGPGLTRREGEGKSVESILRRGTEGRESSYLGRGLISVVGSP